MSVMNLHERIPADLKVIPKFIRALTEKIKQLPLDERQLHDIKLSLHEALVNAMKHGNGLNPDLYVEVHVESRNGYLSVTVSDKGEGFDFQNIPDPTKPDNLQKLSGRGILLIRRHMDKIKFFDCGSRIKMIKFFKKGVKK